MIFAIKIKKGPTELNEEQCAHFAKFISNSGGVTINLTHDGKIEFDDRLIRLKKKVQSPKRRKKK